ncbi:MAG: hypothetical protein ABIH49_00305 [archaeon]
MQILAELVGIPGTGKTYYLNLLKGFVNCIDFGEELSRWLKENKKEEGVYPTAEHIKEFIDFLYLGLNGESAVMTSHIVHYQQGKFIYDLDLEIYAKPHTHIFLYSNPEDILLRRQKDILSGRKQRGMGNLPEIRSHQDISLRVTRELSEKLSSCLLILENIAGNEDENIAKIRHLFRQLNYKGAVTV